MDTVKIDGRLFLQMLRAGSENLRRNKTVVNELNVFPIPDGDTGDNMYMTVKAGCLTGEDEEKTLDIASAKAARGMLLGARGNSGVILSRIFSGIADGLSGNETSDVNLLCRAFKSGVEKAYGAVSVPVEGTILTVYREAAEYVSENCAKYTTLQQLFDDFLLQTRASLERTPELLDVLRKAGVVDSGGAGFYYIVEGMRKALDGWCEDNKELANGKNENTEDSEEITLQADDVLPDDGSTVYGYCTEFLLQLMSSKTDTDKFDTDAFIETLTKMGGESIVAFREGNIVKVHVHTENPGAVLDYCRSFGEFLKVKIENMTLQSRSATIRNRFEDESDAPKLRISSRKKYAIVATAAGDGVKKAFKDAGADYVIDGGQSMNPSAEAFIKAFDDVNADTVIVLPDNGNIVLTAKQAAELYTGSDIRVFDSHSIGEGYAAISVFDGECEDIDSIISAMDEAKNAVHTGMVSVASRDYDIGSVSLKKGEYIGFSGNNIFAVDKDRDGALLCLADKLGASDYGLAIVFCGSETGKENADFVYEELTRLYPSTEIIMLDGGQPIYDYILILE